MHSRSAVLAGILVLAAGCSVVAGVQDIAYGDPAPGTSTSPTDPAGEVEGGSAAAEDGASVPATLDGPPTAPDDATVDATAAVDAAADAALADAADAAADAGDDEDGPGGAGCKAADFAANDRRDPNAARTILFPVPGAQGYTPRCLMIRAGQSVTWQGDLAVDPLEPRTQNPPNPITLTAAGNTVTFTFAKKGRYRYGSATNPIQAMRGAIDVRP